MSEAYIYPQRISRRVLPIGRRVTHGRTATVNARDEIDAIQTTLLRSLASPHRLRIIHLLGEQPREVHEIAQLLEIGQAAASQHLAAMRGVARLIGYRMSGRIAREP